MATVGIVCVNYHAKYLLQTVRALKRIEATLPSLHSVFVANRDETWAALTKRMNRRDASCEVMRHDNSGMEFGAYQAGLDRLLAKCDPDWILIANDTFATRHNFATAYRTKLCAELDRIDSWPTIVGQLESMPRSYRVAGLRTNRWITTNLFAINRAARQALGGRIYRPEIEAQVVETSEMSTFFSLAVDPVLRHHLEAFLFRAHPGWHWYASDPLHPTNAARMAGKARSILQEKYLSALLDDVSADFVDLKRLSVPKKILRTVEDKVFEWTRSS